MGTSGTLASLAASAPTGRIHFPEGTRHGTVLKVTRRTVDKIAAATQE